MSSAVTEVARCFVWIEKVAAENLFVATLKPNNVFSASLWWLWCLLSAKKYADIGADVEVAGEVAVACSNGWTML